MKPFLERCIVKVDKIYPPKEDGKVLVDDSGNAVYEPEQIAKVMSSNIEGIKKGDKVVPLLRGGVPITSEETKKYLVVVLDAEEIYAIK